MALSMKHVIVLLLVLGMSLIVADAAPSQCQEDYSPCTCTEQAPYRSVVCSGVSPDEIKQVFSRTTYPVIHSIELILNSNEQTHLPEDLLNGKVVEVIVIRGSGSVSFQLSIDIGAFSPSKQATRYIEIFDCDLGSLNFGFLNGFSKLQSITLQNVAHVRALRDLPYLRNVTDLYISHGSGFGELYPFPTGSLPSLVSLEVPYSQDIDDDVLAAVMFGLSISPAQQSLRRLNFDGIHVLTRIPTRLSYFPNLESVSFSINSIHLIEGRTTSPVSTSRVGVLTLKSNNLTHVLPGAFAGDFGNTRIHLENNNLHSFPADVFQPLLERMVQADGTGYLFVDSNPLSCDCTIAWLIAHNRHLLERLNGAKCDVSGVPFENLDPNVYVNC